MGGSETGLAQSHAMPVQKGHRILAMHEVLLAANVAAALEYVLLFYISKGLGAWAESEAGYYFRRSAVRINDFLGITSVTPVSVAAVRREIPSPATQIGEELALLVFFLGVTAFFYLLLRLSPQRFAHRTVLSPKAGVVSILALPAFYLCVSQLTWNWKGSPRHPFPFWQGVPFTVFAGEVLFLILVALIFRKRSLPLWIVSPLLLLHCGFWIAVLWPLAPISLRPLYASYLLLFVFLSSGLWWLLCLRVLRAQAFDSAGPRRLGKWALATTLTALALLSILFLPSRGLSLTQPRDMNSVTIEMSRGPCFGACPSYMLTVHGNGLVEYLGERNVRVGGKQTTTATKEQVMQILQHLDRANFFAIEDRAFIWCFDSPTVGVSVSIDGRAKSVVSDAACLHVRPTAQAQLLKAADMIDSIIGTRSWVVCDGPCKR